MSSFTDHLWSDIVREHGATLAHAHRPEPGRTRALRRPRVLAGSSLGLAGVAGALVLALGGSTAAPAFAITTNHDGSVLVTLSYNANQNLPQVNAKLASMGLHETVTIDMARGAASQTGPVSCTQGPGATAPVKILVGTNGTEPIAAGQSAGNTAEGTFHLDHCVVSGANGSGSTGNTGNG